MTMTRSLALVAGLVALLHGGAHGAWTDYLTGQFVIRPAVQLTTTLSAGADGALVAQANFSATSVFSMTSPGLSGEQGSVSVQELASEKYMTVTAAGAMMLMADDGTDHFKTQATGFAKDADQGTVTFESASNKMDYNCDQDQLSFAASSRTKSSSLFQLIKVTFEQTKSEDDHLTLDCYALDRKYDINRIACRAETYAHGGNAFLFKEERCFMKTCVDVLNVEYLAAERAKNIFVMRETIPGETQKALEFFTSTATCGMEPELTTVAPTTEAPATEAPTTEAPATPAPATPAPATQAPAASGAEYQPVVDCQADEIVVTVDKSRVGRMDIDRMYSGGDSDCQGADGGDTMIFTFRHDVCHPQITTAVANHMKFAYNLTTVPDPSQGVSRKHSGRMEIFCLYPRNQVVQVSHEVNRTFATYIGGSSGEFSFSLALYHDSAFTSVMDRNAAVPVGTPVFADVRFENPAPNLNMFVQDCVATPVEVNSTYSYEIIKPGGCYGDDETFAVIAANVQSKRYSFVFEAFRFTGVSTEDVYLTCNLYVCEASEPAEGQCQQPRDCSASAKRSGMDHTQTFSISFGPMKVV